MGHAPPSHPSPRWEPTKRPEARSSATCPRWLTHTLSVQKAIGRDFGSFSTFQKQTNAALAGIQGSGWAWLAKDKESGTLALVTRVNQDPVSGTLIPLMGIDAWEHAYYLQYQNRKAEYFSAIWNVINWNTVAKRFQA